MEIVRYGDKCTIKQPDSGKEVEAEVFEFKEKQKLIVVLNKSVKVSMVWNGRLYEGKMAGIDMISTGPTIKRSTTGR
jgi:flagellar biosynthesis/type III secretory pathway ATPase